MNQNEDVKSKMNRRSKENILHFFPKGPDTPAIKSMSKLPLHSSKNLNIFGKKYILDKMSFVLKECLDKKIVTIIIGIITELRPRLSFLRRVKFLLL